MKKEKKIYVVSKNKTVASILTFKMDATQKSVLRKKGEVKKNKNGLNIRKKGHFKSEMTKM